MMEQNQNILIRLIGYSVDKVSFILNKSFDVKEHPKIKVTPKFDREMTRIDDNTFTMSLSVSFDDPNNAIPFFMDVQISGKFLFTRWEDEKLYPIAKTNATSVLYPYIRALVTTVTANSNVPPYILPVMNSNILFKDKA
jgi:preprotein translocase subunit SecB